MTMDVWVNLAIAKIEADFRRSADTHLLRFDVPGLPGLPLYLKDESTHITGSLKHRLARSLFLYALCNGWVREGTPIIEASSGSTAISEAYFARLLGLPFIAVMPRSTSPQKIAQIEFYGGQCHLVSNPSDVYSESHRLARETGGHFMDQFTYAERATDWRGNNNIAESIFAQMADEDHETAWIVCGAGTGGTSATIGRFVRYQRLGARLCVADPEHSVFYDYYATGQTPEPPLCGSRIEGIGRPRVEPSFLPSVIDAMVRVPDALSLAAMHFLTEKMGRRVGGSTGTNIIAAFHLMAAMKARGEKGAVVTLICDGGERYDGTYYNADWTETQGLSDVPAQAALEEFWMTGHWTLGKRLGIAQGFGANNDESRAAE